MSWFTLMESMSMYLYVLGLWLEPKIHDRISAFKPFSSILNRKSFTYRSSFLISLFLNAAWFQPGSNQTAWNNDRKFKNRRVLSLCFVVSIQDVLWYLLHYFHSILDMGDHHFGRGTVSPEMFAWLPLIHYGWLGTGSLGGHAVLVKLQHLEFTFARMRN